MVPSPRQGGDTIGREWDISTNKSELFLLQLELKKNKCFVKILSN
jgi:hypothetical protein